MNRHSDLPPKYMLLDKNDFLQDGDEIYLCDSRWKRWNEPDDKYIAFPLAGEHRIVRRQVTEDHERG